MSVRAPPYTSITPDDNNQGRCHIFEGYALCQTLTEDSELTLSKFPYLFESIVQISPLFFLRQHANRLGKSRNHLPPASSVLCSNWQRRGEYICASSIS